MRLLQLFKCPSGSKLHFSIGIILGVIAASAACSNNSMVQVTQPEVTEASKIPLLTPTSTWQVTSTPKSSLIFAVIGDYGLASDALQEVADMVIGWSPDLIITTGDNNYPNGSPDTIDTNIGQYFHAFISPYPGGYGPGADTNRFFPALGNHDWTTDKAKPYLDYFTLPGNERYYDFIRGNVHFFMLDSDSREPDGVGRSSIQAQWLKTGLSLSNTTWNVVISHYPPYSSGTHGSTDWMIWPFKDWGASIVLSGHDHNYERLSVDEFPYIVNGLSGPVYYTLKTPVPGSQVRHSYDHCALRAEATVESLIFELVCIPDIRIDKFVLNNPD